MKRVLVWLCVAAACQPAPDRAPARPDTAATPAAKAVAGVVVLRGVVRWAGGAARFTACGAVTAAPVAGSALRAIPSSIAADSAAGIFVLARGRAVDTVQLDTLLFAGSATGDCYLDQSYDARAQGNEPGWVIEVRGAQLKVQRQGGAVAEWGTARRTETAEGTRYSATGEPGPVELTLKSGGCEDSMSGFYYAWSAVLRLGAETLTGCGLRLR